MFFPVVPFEREFVKGDELALDAVEIVPKISVNCGYDFNFSIRIRKGNLVKKVLFVSSYYLLLQLFYIVEIN